MPGSKKKKKGARRGLQKKKGTLPLPTANGKVKVNGSSYTELKLPKFRQEDPMMDPASCFGYGETRELTSLIESAFEAEVPWALRPYY